MCECGKSQEEVALELLKHFLVNNTAELRAVMKDVEKYLNLYVKILDSVKNPESHKEDS